MLRSWKIGSAFGIPLYVHPSFLLLPLLLCITQFSEGWQHVVLVEAMLVVIFTCVILHELGHALTARRFGIRPVDITLYPVGGVARLDRLARSPREELVIAIAGPAVNMVIALLLTPVLFLLLYWAYEQGEIPTPGEGMFGIALSFLGGVWMANLVLVCFNLLPTFPMDGGRVLRAVLSYWFGLLRATEIAVVTGRILSIIGVTLLLFLVPRVLLQNPMLLVVVAFVWIAGYRELRYIRRLNTEEDEDTVPERQRVATPVFEPAYHDLLLRESPSPNYSGFTWDQERRVCIHWQLGQPVGIFFIPQGERSNATHET